MLGVVALAAGSAVEPPAPLRCHRTLPSALIYWAEVTQASQDRVVCVWGRREGRCLWNVTVCSVSGHLAAGGAASRGVLSHTASALGKGRSSSLPLVRCGQMCRT